MDHTFKIAATAQEKLNKLKLTLRSQFASPEKYFNVLQISTVAFDGLYKFSSDILPLSLVSLPPLCTVC